MALTLNQIWEVETTGSDTLNGGGFDASQSAGMFTDGAATTANTNAPVFTSASYNFVAGDVGAWVYISSGTNWTAGWYIISSVAANAATLNGTIGQAITAAPLTLSTVIGCATVASPTGATWSIDYSQQAAAAFAYTDLVSAGTGLTVSSAAKPFNKQQVGNTLVITGGTNFNTGRYVIASIGALNVATVIGPTNITTGAGASGTGGLGGALISPGLASLLTTLAGQRIFIKAGTYSITSATPNISAGCLTPIAGAYVEGYQTLRTDMGTPPLLQASGISTFTLVTIAFSGAPTGATNLRLDGAGLTSSRGITIGGTGIKLTVENCTNRAFNASNAILFRCIATGCSTVGAYLLNASNAVSCIAHTNTIVGFQSNGSVLYTDCIAYNNSGATTDGFILNRADMISNCVSYGNGRAGFITNDDQAIIINCIAEGNTGFGFSNTFGTVFLFNCAAFSNTAGNTSLGTAIAVRSFNFVTGSSSFFTNAAGADFSLNNTAGGGAAARGTGYPGVLPIGGTGFLDIGALQHQDSGSSGGGARLAGIGGLASSG